MTRATRIIRGAAMMLLLPVFPVAAGEPPVPRSIEVTGEARVEVPADLALLDFGVVTQAETAAGAARENAQRMEAVLGQVRKVAGAQARIGTGTYSIRPIHAAVRDGGAPRLTGYEVSNVVHLKTQTLSRVAEVIDAAVRAGANNVQRLEFTLSDDTKARHQALGAAVTKAREKAATVAASLGVKLGEVHALIEQDVGLVRPLARQAALMHAESAPLTPLEPGQVEVRARVVLTSRITP